MPSKRKSGAFSTADIDAPSEGHGAFSEADLAPVATSAPVPVQPEPTPTLGDKLRSNAASFTAHVPTTGVGSVIQNAFAGAADTVKGAADFFNPKSSLYGASNLTDLADQSIAGFKDYLNDPIAYHASQAGQLAGQIGIGELSDMAHGKLSPKSLPPLESPRMSAAKEISQAINPGGNHIGGLDTALHDTGADILDYAKKNGISPSSQEGFLAASKGLKTRLGGELDKLLDNLGTRTFATEPNGLGRMTAKEMDTQIRNNNAEIAVARQTGNPIQRRGRMLNVQDLQAENQNLTQTLHKVVGDAHGITPEQVADLRQRLGKVSDVEGLTRMRVEERRQAAGRKNEGEKNISGTKTGMLSTAYNDVIRGGPKVIADKAMAKAVKQYANLPDLMPAAPLTPQLVNPKPLPPLQVRVPIPTNF